MPSIGFSSFIFAGKGSVYVSVSLHANARASVCTGEFGRARTRVLICMRMRRNVQLYIFLCIYE